jgi:hypothetical protein
MRRGRLALTGRSLISVWVWVQVHGAIGLGVNMAINSGRNGSLLQAGQVFMPKQARAGVGEGQACICAVVCKKYVILQRY